MKKQLNADNLRQFCINNDYFDLGCNTSYAKLFDLLDMNKVDKAMLWHDLTLAIWLCSDYCSPRDVSDKMHRYFIY